MRFKAVFFLFLLLIQIPFAEGKLIVFAAASLKDALEALAKNYKKSEPNLIVFSFAASSTLSRQIESGSPADLFISADEKWMNALEDKNLLEPGTKISLLGNTLVLIAPENSPLKTLTLDETTPWEKLLAQGEFLSVGDPSHVPAGIYAKEALEKLSAWQKLSSRLARASDVRSALLLVERGESPLGIVYGSDALISPKVKVIATFSESSHSKIIYPLAIIKGKKSAAAMDFYEYLKSENAMAIFKRYGFESLKLNPLFSLNETGTPASTSLVCRPKRWRNVFP